jgi:uncharacterized iron-regulated protein
MMPRLLVVLVVAALVSCGGPPPKDAARGAARATAPAPPSKKPAAFWTTKLGIDHPLVGTTWDVAHEKSVDRSELLARLGSANRVLLGEKHDNPDHHRLQAEELRAAASSESKPLLVWELLEPTESAWPPWNDYAPIADVAVALHLPMAGTAWPRAEMRALVRDPERLRSALGSAPVLPAPARAELIEELRRDHCGHLPDSMIDAMELAQRLKDATMAAKMTTSPRAVLIAGNGHVRSDRGVPFYLGATKDIVSVGHVEVETAVTDPRAYAGERSPVKGMHADKLPYDYVVFTPRATDEDPCEAFHK